MTEDAGVAARRAEWAVFAVCGAVALAPLWVASYLPMCDLPQHAAQVSIWIHLDDPAYGLGDQFRVNGFTPYLLGYALARLFAVATTVPVALKAVLSLYVVALPLSLRHLMIRTGGDRWWALAGFPLAYGSSFYWGFFPFLVALPVGLAFLAEAYAYSLAPSVRGGVRLAILGTVLFFGHLLVLAEGALVAALWIGARPGGARTILVRALPLVVPVGLALTWVLTASADEAPLPLEWGASLARLGNVPEHLLGFPGTPHPTSREAIAGAAALAGALALTLGGVARDWRRWLPGLVTLGIFTLAPLEALGVSLFNERFAVLLLPLALVAVVPTASRRRVWPGRALLATVAIAWSVLLVGRFRAFDAEAAGFEKVVSALPRGRAVFGLVFLPMSGFAPGFPYLHFTAWCQAEKGGRLGYSFAGLAPSIVRYRPGRMPRTRRLLTWVPMAFDPALDGVEFEYFVISDEADRRAQLFPGNDVPEVVAHDGDWWLLRRAGAGGA